jgi:hypothetical protein
MLSFKSAIALAVLCACAFSAFATQSAVAEQKAFTCENVGAGAFADAHCVTANPGGEYGHAEIVNSVFASATNARTASETTTAAVSKLKGTLSGVITEVQCTTVGGWGKITNAAASVTGTGVLEYSGCTVTLPAGKGCVVNGGRVNTKKLTATTVGQAANAVEVTPSEGAEFAGVKIESCSVGVLNNTFPVTGSLVATANGATLNTAHAGITTQNTLRLGGNTAGLEGAITITGLVAAPAAVTLT